MIQAFDFFERLSANNNRPWFQEHKPEYDAIRAEWIEGMERLIPIVAAEWPRIRTVDARRATYRIYRDTRFSLDKTPYKTHIGTSLDPPELRGRHCGLYIEAGLSDGMTGVWGGIWCPASPDLRKLRQAIADNDDEFLAIVNDPALTDVYGTHMWGDTLKTAPKGFPKDHPMIQYLRLKELGKYCPVPRSVFASPDWPEALAERILPVIPLTEFIAYSLLED